METEASTAPSTTPPSTLASTTPMMRQWSALKAQAGSSLLFFRLGDFYELFDEDAKIAAPALGIVLTSRNQKSPDAIALCGIPIHQFENYVGKLLDAGHSIALAEQMELPQPGKTLVRREIVQWLTPGMRLLPQDDRAHFCATWVGDLKSWSLAAADVNTGQVQCFEAQGLDELQELIDRMPIEDLRFLSEAPEGLRIKCFKTSQTYLDLESAKNQIARSLNFVSLEDSPSKNDRAHRCLGSLLKILSDSHPRDELRFFALSQDPHAVQLSAATRRHLNLFERDGLFQFMDRSQTAFGRRELKRILSEPTQNAELILSRQELIYFLKKNPFIRKKLRERLNGVLDLPRLLRRQSKARDLFRISESLDQAQHAIQLLTPENNELGELRNLAEVIRPLCDELKNSLQTSDDPETGWIKPKVLKDLDELRDLEQNQSRLLSELEEKLRQELKASSLKIKFHQVQGYVIEVTALHKEKIPAGARKIQSLANAERFKTDELEKLEEKILSLSSRVREAENSEISRLFEKVFALSAKINTFIQLLASLDAAQSLAEISVELQWSRPETLSSRTSEMQITEATHPLVPRCIPLSLHLNADKLQIVLLTGPNMAGKSTLLRMTALLALLHQIGSDVPAKNFKASVFDRIMCRMGAIDDVTTGQSTFFVEMKEVAQMLKGASSKSLLLFDEIGRGTSTFDGMSLAWAITEAVHESKSLSLVATHYLELAELEKTCARLKSYHLGVEEHSGKLIFTRKLLEGPASRSYGIHVARLASLDSAILKRAEQKLQELEAAGVRLPENKAKRAPSLAPLFEWNQKNAGL